MWAHVIVGIWMIIYPFLWAPANATSKWLLVILGAVQAVWALVTIFAKKPLWAWAHVIVGIWLIIHPFVFSDTGAVLHWTWVLGLVGAIVALVVALSRGGEKPMAGGEGQ